MKGSELIKVEYFKHKINISYVFTPVLYLLEAGVSAGHVGLDEDLLQAAALGHGDTGL